MTTLAPAGAGFTLNDTGADAAGVVWDWTSDNVNGGGAQIRENTGDNASRDGQWDASRFLGAQTFAITGYAKAPTHEALHDAERRLRALLLPVAYTDWTLTEPGSVGVFTARRQGDLLWTEITPTWAQFSFTLYCPDSTIRATTASTFSLTFGGASGGPDWTSGVDWTAGVDWSSTGGSNSAVLSNPGLGAAPVPMVLTLTGPVTSATIAVTSASGTQTMYLTNQDVPGADLLTAGQTLTVNTGAHSVLLNGNGSRRYWMAGSWPLVPPGASTIYLTGLGSGTVTGSYTPAHY